MYTNFLFLSENFSIIPEKAPPFISSVPYISSTTHKSMLLEWNASVSSSPVFYVIFGLVETPSSSVPGSVPSSQTDKYTPLIIVSISILFYFYFFFIINGI